jgi:hypothetical protein
MDKRLLKRHKRKVARAKEHVKLSEPDLRTPEQIKAAREASRAPEAGRGGPSLQNSALSFRSPSHATGGASKTDASG